MYNINDLYTTIQASLGVTPKNINLDGSFIRFDIDKKGDKAGWLTGSEWDYNGKTYAYATFGSWKHSNAFQVWKTWTKTEELKDKTFTVNLENQRKEIEKKHAKQAKENKEKILESFSEFSPAKEDNFYLNKKKIGLNKYFLQDKIENLIIPIYEDFDRTLAGYQKITKERKEFPSGQQVKGNFFFFGDYHSSDLVYLAEGIATAATIFEITKKPTICCFNAGNIPNVVPKIKRKNVVICADNDEAGLSFAHKAKLKFGNSKVIKPVFPKNSELSDFNDYFLVNGFEKTKQALKVNESDFENVILLGHKTGSYYFYSEDSREVRFFPIEKIKAGSLVEMASNKYWASNFVMKTDIEGLPTGKCDWQNSLEEIIKKQQKIGIYKEDRIKGRGSWLDGKNHILNLGNKLLVNMKERPFGPHADLNKFYIPNFEESLPFEETKKEPDFSPIIKAFDLIDLKSEKDRIILIGLIGIAQIFTTQKWRPHAWIRADYGTGKSSLLFFLNKLINQSVVFQDSTAAGIRQFASANACVCLVDEAEGESLKTTQLIELARQSSSGADTKIVRGTPGGNGFSFNPELMFIFASIRAAKLTPADETRIFEVFMEKPKENSVEKNNKRSKYMKEAMLMKNELFNYMNTNANLFNEYRLEVKEAMQTHAFLENRFIDQYAPIIASYGMINPGRDFREVFEILTKDKKEKIDDKTDQSSFYDAFMNIILKDHLEQKTIVQWVEKAEKAEKIELESINQFLEMYGMKYLPTKKAMFVFENRNLELILSKTTEFKNYYKQMKNSDFFLKTKQKIRNNPKHGYFIKKFRNFFC